MWLSFLRQLLTSIFNLCFFLCNFSMRLLVPLAAELQEVIADWSWRHLSGERQGVRLGITR